MMLSELYGRIGQVLQENGDAPIADIKTPMFPPYLLKISMCIILLMSILLTACTNTRDQVDPLRFKGCVVDRKIELIDCRQLKLKLTNELRDSLGYDYYIIEVSMREYDLLNEGDTIK